MDIFVFALASDATHVRRMVEALARIGITSDEISVLAADRKVTGNVAEENHTQVAHGAFSGGNIGGGIGWLAGLTTLAIPGIGLFIAAGPILGFLAGIAVGRSIGNLNGAMIEEMGIPDASVQHYQEAMKDGKIIISTKCADPALVDHVTAVMQQVGAVEIGSSLTASSKP